MTAGTNDYALLSKDSYESHKVGDKIILGGHSYRVFASTSDAVTGYQGTAYQRMDTGEVIIAHRGTEQIGRDGALTDGGMVLAGVNAQTADAMAFTKRTMEEARKAEPRFGHPLNITVTGHSLGGTLAEITAYKYGLHGETFNAYGAVDLMQGIPEGGSQIVNHVCATDVVSAGSRHYGKVMVYATAADIQRLEHAGYRDENTLFTPRNPTAAIDMGAHGIDNFVPDSKRLGHSIISRENAARYHEHQSMIDRYRDDVFDLRTGLSLRWQAPYVASQAVQQGLQATEQAVSRGLRATGEVAVQGAQVLEHGAQHAAHEVAQGARAIQHVAEHAAHAVTEEAGRAWDTTRRTAAKTARATEHALSQGAPAAERAAEAASHHASQAVGAVGRWLGSKAVPDPTMSAPASASDKAPPAKPVSLNQTAHPDHALFRQALIGVHRVDARIGRTPDQHSDNLAGALTVAAKIKGMAHIDEVAVNEDGTRAFAAQNHDAYNTYAEVSTEKAIATTLAQSSAAALVVSVPTAIRNPYAESQEPSLQTTQRAALGLH